MLFFDTNASSNRRTSRNLAKSNASNTKKNKDYTSNTELNRSPVFPTLSTTIEILHGEYRFIRAGKKLQTREFRAIGAPYRPNVSFFCRHMTTDCQKCRWNSDLWRLDVYHLSFLGSWRESAFDTFIYYITRA